MRLTATPKWTPGKVNLILVKIRETAKTQQYSHLFPFIQMSVKHRFAQRPVQ
jgi:hypothetical protein